MKKFLLSAFACSLLAVGTYAANMSQTISPALLNEDDSGYTSESQGQRGPNISSFDSDDLDITCSGGFNSNCFCLSTANLWIYSSNSMTVKPKQGSNFVITGISFRYADAVGTTNNAQPLSGSYYQNNISKDMEFSVNGAELFWTMNPSDNVTEIIINGPSTWDYPAKINYFTITYAPAPVQSDVEQPQILGQTPFLESTTVTIIGSGEVFYTLDGTDPDMESTPYTEPFNLDKTTEVRAINYVSGFASNIVKKTFEKQTVGPDLPQILVNGNKPVNDNVSLPYEQVCSIGFRPIEGADIYFTRQILGQQEVSQPEIYTAPFEVSVSTQITYWAEMNGIKGESGIFKVYVDKAPEVIDGIPDGIVVSPAPGNVRGADFSDKISVMFNSAAYILASKDCTLKVTKPDNTSFTRFLDNEKIATDELYTFIQPTLFDLVGEYTVEVDISKARIENSASQLLSFPNFRFKYNVTESGLDAEPVVPESVDITPKPGSYGAFDAQTAIRIVFNDIFTFIGADEQELLTVKTPDGISEDIRALWDEVAPNVLTFIVPAGLFDPKGTYTCTVTLSNVQIITDPSGTIGKMQPFSFKYTITGDSGIGEIILDNEAEYFTLTGSKVSGQPAPGIYVVRRADKTYKEIIK